VTAYIDFETRSVCDLRKSGVEVYAEHPTTEGICLSWAIGADRPQSVNFLDPNHEPPRPLIEWIAAGGDVVAHNARFELSIWRMLRRRQPNVWPELRLEQLHDTMALALSMSLPAALGDLAKALRLPIEKDTVGHKLMLQMCKPRKPRKGEPTDRLLWKADAESVARLIEYCERDVEVERDVHKLLLPLIPRERKLWVIDQRINDRGVCVDVANVRRLRDAAALEKIRLDGELKAATGALVGTANSSVALRSYLAAEGVAAPDLRKDTVEKLLKGPLPDAVRRIVEIRQEAAKSSVAKLAAMLNGAGADNRCRGILAFHGAGTGRWAGRRVQPQNMPRTPEDFEVSSAETVMSLLAGGHRDAVAALFGSTMDAVSWSLRSLICASPGNRLLCADYSNIEGRGLAWLAGENWKLQAFRDYDAGNGADLYKLAYSKSFGVPVDRVTKDDRQIGKVQELALGYQGGHGAFLSMAKNYRIDLDKIARAVQAAVPPGVWSDTLEAYWSGARETAEEILAAARLETQLAIERGEDVDAALSVDELAAVIARKHRYGLEPAVWAAVRIIVDGWRVAHPATVARWRALETAAIDAVRHPGKVTQAGKIKYLKTGDYLICRLPSGRPIFYPYARTVEQEGRNGRPYFKLIYEGTDSRTRKWRTQKAYGGLLCENVTQATARCILSDAIHRLEAANYPVAMHVHDEIVSELPHGRGSLSEFVGLMSELEPWAAGFPVIAAGEWEGLRYRK
jgi:DNA polymerase bacteriophage-type